MVVLLEPLDLLRKPCVLLLIFLSLKHVILHADGPDFELLRSTSHKLLQAGFIDLLQLQILFLDILYQLVLGCSVEDVLDRDSGALDGVLDLVGLALGFLDISLALRE